MARISGVNLPLNKQVHIALTYIYGIGDYNAQKICKQLNIEKSKRVNNLTEDEILKIREFIDNKHTVEGDLRRNISLNIKRLRDLGTYRGTRQKLPVRGQRTHSNARTRKGKAIAIAGKKLTLAKK